MKKFLIILCIFLISGISFGQEMESLSNTADVSVLSYSPLV